MLATEIPAHFIKSGPPEGNRVAFTFDDGPTPGITDKILDELKQRNLVATFYMIGQCVAAAPDLARRVLAEGHEIANHTYTHPRLDGLTDAAANDELQKTQDIFARELNYHARWFRPPCAAFREDQAHLPYRKGLGIVYWTVDPGDWAQPGEDKITEIILTGAKPGSIVLCHDRHPQTANCIGRVLDGLLERQLSLVTTSALLDHLHPGRPT